MAINCVLLSTFVGEYMDCKNIAGMNNRVFIDTRIYPESI